MKLYTKAKCRNCGKCFIASVVETTCTKEEVITSPSDYNFSIPKILHDCNRDDVSEDESIVGIADVIGLIFKET